MNSAISIRLSAFQPMPKATLPAPPKYLLSVPFYVYEEFAWINGTIGNSTIDSVMRYHSYNGTNRYKHGDDYWFLQASLKHPMRTRNMDEAKLFFVPVLLNQFDYFVNMKKPLCVNGRCNMVLMNYTTEQLAVSPAWQKHPEKHIVVRSHYLPVSPVWDVNKTGRLGYAKFFLEMLPKMNAVIFEGIDFLHQPRSKTHNNRFDYPSRYTLNAYKVGNGCENGLAMNKDLDVAMIANMRFWFRQTLCTWVNRSPWKSFCGKGDRCPTLARAKFGFHMVGDTAGSQRLMDIILCGAVPIFTHEDQFKVQGTWIDWKQLSYYIPFDHHKSKWEKRATKRAKEREDRFMSRLDAILKDEEGYQQRYRAVLNHIPFFDMSTLYPFDTYMYLMQAKIYPLTRHAKSRWSALILPPVLFSEPNNRSGE